MHQVKFYNHSLSSKGNQAKSKDLKLQTLTLVYQIFIVKTSKPHIFFNFSCPFWTIFMVMGAPTGSPQCLFQIHRQPTSKNFKFSDIGLSTLPNNDYFNGKFHFLWLFLNLKNMLSKCKMGFSTHKKIITFVKLNFFWKENKVHK